MRRKFSYNQDWENPEPHTKMSWIRNLSLKGKFALAFGVCLTTTVISSVAAIRNSNLVEEHVHSLQTDAFPGLAATYDMSHAFNELYLGDSESALTGAAEADRKSKLDEVQKQLDAYEATITTADDKANFKKLKDSASSYESKYAAFTKTDAGGKGFETSVKPLFFNELRPELATIAKWNVDAGNKGLTGTMTLANQARANNLALTLIALVLGIGSSLLLSRYFISSLSVIATRFATMENICINGVSNAADAFSKGDFTADLPIGTKPIENPTNDELGKIAQNVNSLLTKVQGAILNMRQTQDNLSTLIKSIQRDATDLSETSTSLAAISEESGSASHEIATGSDKLASSATDAAAVMQGLYDKVQGVSTATEHQSETLAEALSGLGDAQAEVDKVAAAAEEMAAIAQEGSESVTATVSAMDTVCLQVKDATTKVTELDSMGQEIGAIVQTIEGIAEQTNLLALNAAIEAARAGEHGRGFAVVADEVRKLAELSSASTKEIGALISKVRATVIEAVDSINVAQQQAEEGASRTAEAGTALGEIVQASKSVAEQAETMAMATHKVNEMMREVRDISDKNQQAILEVGSGASDVSESIANVAAVSEESAAGAQELTASVQETSEAAQRLSAMATNLQNVLSQFKTKDVEDKPKLKVAA